ncbi:hypothetical protein C9I56_29830 [Paraburkholderia caribensis]|nr:hypothetical protein C9I56_29830 [Paraburkholderia caribensis]
MVCAAQVANCVSAFAPYAHHSGLKSGDGVSCKNAESCGAPTYTQFATWATEDCLAWRAVTRVYEAGEAYIESAGSEGEQICCRVKYGDVGGPWANVKHWRCEPLSFAYFSLRRQRKVGAAPHRGDA